MGVEKTKKQHKKKLKAPLIHVFILTIGQKSKCNVTGGASSDKPTVV